MKSSSKLIALLLLSLCLPTLMGCADFDLRRPIPWVHDDKDDANAPGEVVVFWQNAIHNQAGRAPTRGFGGRVMFHDQKKGDPTKVEGTLVIYAFDEANRQPGDNCPTKKYVVSAEDLVKQYSESDLGHSYSIWIPWDEVGGPTSEVSLIARFIPPGGTEVVSGQATVMLPGRDFLPAEELAEQRSSSDARDRLGVRRVSFEEEPREESKRMTSTTIKIPSRSGAIRRIAQTGNSQDRSPRASSARNSMSATIRTAEAAVSEEPQDSREFVPTEPRSTRYSRARFQPPTSSNAALARDRDRLQQSRIESRFPRDQSELRSVTVR